MEHVSKLKLSMGTKIGFGVASIADATAYDFIASFFLFFLTDVAGITPAFAGTIIFIAVLWDAITDPIIGMWSDHSKSKYGKRRPFLVGSAIPLGIAVALLFLTVGFEGMAKNMYYLAMAIIFWTAYTAFNIPYYALGASLTLDNDERTRLSAVRQIFNYVGLFCASALPSFLIGSFIEKGYEVEDSWFYAAIILGSVITLSILITWRATRGKELIAEEETESKGLIKEVLEVLKLKSYVLIIFAALFYMISYTLLTADILYFTSYILGVGEMGAGVLFTVVVIAGIIISALLGKVAVQFDKRTVFIACLTFTGIVMIAMKLIGITSMTSAVIYMVLYSFGSAAYWTLIYNLLYDVAEVDEFKSGKRREGVIVSYYSFFIKLGGAVAAQIAGVILEFSGYNAETMEQGESEIDAIVSLFTLYPGIFMLLCALMIVIFPITKPRYEALTEALELKKQGKEFSTEGFEKLL